MTKPLRLIGYGPSIYCWSVRLALAELGLQAEWVEADPFEGRVADHPFNRVPVLWAGDLRLYETAAILEWLFEPPPDRTAAAEARQVAGIADAYAYWPMVRQVYAKAVRGPALGAEPDPEKVAAGLAAADPVLEALDEIAQGGWVLAPVPGRLTAADCHLAPMIGAFAAAEDGRTLLHRRAALREWFASVTQRPNWAATCPDPRILGR